MPSRSISFMRCAGSNIPVVGCGLRVIGAVPIPQPMPLGFAQIFPSSKRCFRPLNSTIAGAWFRYGESKSSCQLASRSCTCPSASIIRRLFILFTSLEKSAQKNTSDFKSHYEAPNAAQLQSKEFKGPLLTSPPVAGESREGLSATGNCVSAHLRVIECNSLSQRLISFSYWSVVKPCSGRHFLNPYSFAPLP